MSYKRHLIGEQFKFEAKFDEVSREDWCGGDKIAEERDGKICTISGIVDYHGEDADSVEGYFYLIFDDKVEMEGISGFHLTKILPAG